MIFMHNGGSFGDIWHRQFDYFSRTHRVYALDFLGYGRSDPHAHEGGIDLHYETLRALIVDQQLRSPILVGVCIGACVAMYYNIRHPRDVEKLVLVNVCPGIRFVQKPLTRALLRFILNRPWAKRIFAKVAWPLCHTALARRGLPDKWYGESPELASPLYRRLKGQYGLARHDDARFGLLMGIDSFTPTNFLTSSETLAPSLMIWGERNVIVPLKEGLYLKKIINPTRFHCVSGAGHLVMEERHAEVTDEMTSFL